MTDASAKADRAGGLRPEPVPVSAVPALIPSADHAPPTGYVATLCDAALAVIQAFGGNIPDWIDAEIQELIDALADVNHGPIEASNFTLHRAIPTGERPCRHCEGCDPHCSVCEGVGTLP